MVVQYKCPNCGADMAFDSTTGMLHCESCGRNENIENMPNKDDDGISEGASVDSNNNYEYEEDTSGNSKELNEFNENEINQYHCKNCGAVLITDKDTTATTCSFCGAGIVLADRLSGSKAPAKVIPFSINKQQAQEAFRKWCKKGLLTPKGFMTADRIKSITGLYIPFWLYDLNGFGEADAECTKVRTYPEGEYIYTETKHYNVYRQVDLNYLKVPADASEKMNDELMDKLEPYHYDNLKDFNMPYLAGYLAERYNYDDKELFPRMKARVEEYVDSYIDSSIMGYTTTRYNSKNIKIRELNADYVLLPVWMVCYDYKQSEHTFAMNGQTGKIVGKPPLSKGKIAAWFAGISGASFIILKLIAVLMGGNLI
jgi:DNA-directed RNA polymerase subunit RPC12/RpoP